MRAILTKFTTVAIFIFVYVATKAQFNVTIKFHHPQSFANSDTIYYDTAHQLNWDNFQGKPVFNGKAGAITTAGFGYKAGLHSIGAQSDFTIHIYCFFSKSRSWVLPDKKLPYVLNHEQKHFDIAYIGTCVFIKKLQEATFTNKNYKKLLTDIYNDTYTFMNKLQGQYDRETNNGQLEAKQQEWDKKIEDLLQGFKSYY